MLLGSSTSGSYDRADPTSLLLAKAQVRSYYPRPAFALHCRRRNACCCNWQCPKKGRSKSTCANARASMASCPVRGESLGARAGTESVSTPSNVIADALLAVPSTCMLVRTTRIVHPSPSYHPIHRLQERTHTQRQAKDLTSSPSVPYPAQYHCHRH